MMHPDGTVHFSSLKQFALSPAHYLWDVTHEKTLTYHMRIGALVDTMLLTDENPIIYEGDRRGKAWELFRDAHQGARIYTSSEAEIARAICGSAIMSELARKYLGIGNASRQTQVPLRWETNGVPRSTRGVDVIVDKCIVDLKVPNTTHPERWMWHARRRLWHAQVSDYEDACKQNGIDVSGGVFLVGIESTPPYPVTVLRLTPKALEEGRRCLASWIEMYKNCASSNEWPGYTQSVIDFDIDTIEQPDVIEEDD